MTDGRSRGRRRDGRRSHPRAIVAILAVSAALVAAACGGGAPAADAGSPPPRDTVSRRTLDSLRLAVEEAIGGAEASSPSACRVVALGAKPCGGPRAYLPYSTEATDSAGLAELVRRYDALDARHNAEQGLLSDCSLVIPPAVTLSGGRCMALPGRPGAPSSGTGDPRGGATHGGLQANGEAGG